MNSELYLPNLNLFRVLQRPLGSYFERRRGFHLRVFHSDQLMFWLPEFLDCKRVYHWVHPFRARWRLGSRDRAVGEEDVDQTMIVFVMK